MRFLSVCSGIEAASVAWNPLGWRAVAVSEIEPFPCHVLAHRHGAGRPLFMPDPEAAGLSLNDRRARRAAIKAMSTVPEAGRIPNFGDMTQFKEWPDVPDVSLLVGGTPCQSFSVAGLRQGMDDPRGNLALTYLALAARYRPRWLVWENVPGVLSSNGGRDFGAILGGMVKLGYGFAYRVLDAQHVRTCRLPFAVPQRRRRVFVVAYLGDWRPAAAVLFDSQSLRGDPPPRREAGKGAAPTPAAHTRGGGGLGTDFEVDGGLIARRAFGGNNTSGPIEVATAVNAHGGSAGRLDFESETFITEPPVANSLRAEGFDVSEDGTGRGTPLVPVAFDSKASQPQALEDGVTPTLRAMNHAGIHANAGGQMAVAFDMRGREGGAMPEGPHDTANIRAASGGSSRSYVAQGQPVVAFNARQDPDVSGDVAHPIGTKDTGHGILHRWAVRRLTPLECERLQGFPDGYTDVPYRGRSQTPDGPRYKALGNSFAVNVVDWIGQRIELVEKMNA